jgi:outer membrane protein assembly factor BamB
MLTCRFAFQLMLAVFLLSSSELLAAEKKTAGGDWPQWRGPERNGLSTETGLNTDWEARPPKLLWTAEGLGEGYASVAVSGGRIYTTGNLETGQGVVAIDVKSGEKVWSQPFTESVPQHSYTGSRCTPTVDGDMLYVVSSEGTIACLNSKDGTIVWRRHFKDDWKGRMMSGWGFSESPLVDGDRLICTPGGDDAMIVALNKKTGEEIWRSAVPNIGGKGNDGAGYGSIVISEAAGVKQYVQMIGRGVIAVRADNGMFLWGYNPVANGTANIPTPIISGDFVFCSTGYGTGAALLQIAQDGDSLIAEEIYFLPAKTFENHHGGMVLVGDHIYCGHKHNNGFPVCLDMKMGEVVWGGERGPGSGSAAVTYYDGHLVFRYQSGDVALIEASPEGMKLKGVFKADFVQSPSWAHPVVAGGRLYLREQDKLMCYDLK